MSDKSNFHCESYSESDIDKLSVKPTKRFVKHLKECTGCYLRYSAKKTVQDLKDYHQFELDQAKLRRHKCLLSDQLIDFVFSGENLDLKLKILECNDCTVGFLKYSQWFAAYTKNNVVEAKFLKMIFRQPIIDLIIDPCVTKEELEKREAGELHHEAVERIDQHLCYCQNCAEKYVDRWLAVEK